MTDLYKACLSRAEELLKSGEAARVVGWKKGEFAYDPSPAYFESVEELKDFTYDYFCGSNLSKYLVQIAKKEGKTAVFLKPCDTTGERTSYSARKNSRDRRGMSRQGGYRKSGKDRWRRRERNQRYERYENA